MTMVDEGHYQVSWSRQAMDALKELAAAMADSSQRAKLAQAVRVIDQRLRSAPQGFGEVYRSRGVVEEYLAVHGFLAVDFAADRARRFVLVRRCRALSL